MTAQAAADQAECAAVQRYLEMRALWSPAWGLTPPGHVRIWRRADLPERHATEN